MCVCVCVCVCVSSNGLMVIIIGNEHRNTSSNPEPGCLHFPSRYGQIIGQIKLINGNWSRRRKNLNWNLLNFA